MQLNLTPHRKKILLIVGISVIIIGAAGYATYVNFFKKEPPSKPVVKTTPTPTPVPTTLPSDLDGTLVTPELATRHPLSIMIENSPDARPQVGLTDASIVFETVSEGGITRFEAIFGPRIPAKAGPVRSARTYFVKWAKEIDAFYAHVGGAGDALSLIKNLGVKDMDQFSIGKAAYWREPRAGVATEHTMFTDPAKLYNIAWQRNWPKEGSFTKWTFKDDAPEAARPAGGTISVNFSNSNTFAAKYTYDKASNTYLRQLAGAPHKDKASGAQIAPKNVIVYQAAKITKAGKKDHDLQLIGSGEAKIYTDGKEIIGTWKKESETTRTMFFDAAGAPVQFNRGQTWIEVTEPGRPATWTPA